MDSFEIFNTKDLKISIGRVAVDEEFEIVLCDYKAFAVGGVFLIKTKDDILGWYRNIYMVDLYKYEKNIIDCIYCYSI